MVQQVELEDKKAAAREQIKHVQSSLMLILEFMAISY